MNTISPIRAATIAVAPPPLAETNPAAAGAGFGEYLKASLESVEDLGKQAKRSAERFLSGEGEELHQVALSAQKAELSFELFLQVRNKVVQAYQEVMRTQV